MITSEKLYETECKRIRVLACSEGQTRLVHLSALSPQHNLAIPAAKEEKALTFYINTHLVSSTRTRSGAVGMRLKEERESSDFEWNWVRR